MVHIMYLICLPKLCTVELSEYRLTCDCASLPTWLHFVAVLLWNGPFVTLSVQTGLCNMLNHFTGQGFSVWAGYVGVCVCIYVCARNLTPTSCSGSHLKFGAQLCYAWWCVINFWWEFAHTPPNSFDQFLMSRNCIFTQSCWNMKDYTSLTWLWPFLSSSHLSLRCLPSHWLSPPKLCISSPF